MSIELSHQIDKLSISRNFGVFRPWLRMDAEWLIATKMPREQPVATPYMLSRFGATWLRDAIYAWVWVQLPTPRVWSEPAE